MSSGDFGALSVLVQTFGAVRYLFSVPKECFTPVPKVESAVISYEALSDRKEIPHNLESILKIAFSNPRKKLFSNLLRLDSKENLTLMFENLGLKENTRAHEVSCEKYIEIARRFI